jgi:hypothetical protein
MSNPIAADFGVNRAVNAFFGDHIKLTREPAYKTWFIQKEE